MTNRYIFTSESVTRGHPDKICDQVSDAIVDHFLRQDQHARIVAECALASGVMFVSTHYASSAKVDTSDIARRTLSEIGYPKEVFDAERKAEADFALSQAKSVDDKTKLVHKRNHKTPLDQEE